MLNSVNSDVWWIQQTLKAQAIKVKAHKKVSLQNVIAEELNDQLLTQTVHNSLNLHMNKKNGQNITDIIIVQTTHSERIIKALKKLLKEYQKDDEYVTAFIMSKSSEHRKRKRSEASKADFVDKNSSDQNDDKDFDDTHILSDDEKNNDFVQRPDFDENNELRDQNIYTHLLTTTLRWAWVMMQNKNALEQKQFDQKKFNIQMILKLNPNYVYISMNMKNSDTLKQALILLCQAWFSAEASHLQLTPYINYDALSAAVVQVIKQRMKIDVKEKVRLIKLFFKTPIV